MQCANSQEDDRWTIPRNQDASSRVAPAGVMPNVNLRHPGDDFRSNVVRRALFVGSRRGGQAAESRPTRCLFLIRRRFRQRRRSQDMRFFRRQVTVEASCLRLSAYVDAQRLA